MAVIAFISEKNRERYMRIISPIGNFFVRIGIHPDILTGAGLILSLLAGLIYCDGSFFLAAWVLVLAGSCDALDGHIARRANKHSPFGAFMDSTLDRYSDIFPLLGMAYHFAGGPPLFGAPAGAQGAEPAYWTIVVIILAVTGSFMVSYTRARAEALGVPCKKGLMQRPERIVLVIIGSLLGAIPEIGVIMLKIALILLALTTNITAIHRMYHVRTQLLKENRAQ
jgi:CDP-diacylglycerol--glycerol-3-phosphate 3-phosphatidyltransferase